MKDYLTHAIRLNHNKTHTEPVHISEVLPQVIQNMAQTAQAEPRKEEQLEFDFMTR